MVTDALNSKKVYNKRRRNKFAGLIDLIELGDLFHFIIFFIFPSFDYLVIIRFALSLNV